MNLLPYFESILQQDEAPVVVCDLDHNIIFMNHSAEKMYPEIQTGAHIFQCHPDYANQKIIEVVNWFAQDQMNNTVHTFYNQKLNKDVYMVALRDQSQKLIGYYEKHIFRTTDDTPFYDYGSGE